jgi:hypothetical protein
MSGEKRATREQESWRVMAKPLTFAVGVPIGIPVGALVAAFYEICDKNDPAAWGVVFGFVSAGVVGGAYGLWATTGTYMQVSGLKKLKRTAKFRWVRSKLTVADSEAVWDAVEKALNVKAAEQHFLMVRREPGYLAYSPMLFRPVAAGPLTVSGEYMSVIVTRPDETTINITGPQYMVAAFEEPVIKAVAAAEAAGREPFVDDYWTFPL